LAKATYMKLYD